MEHYDLKTLNLIAQGGDKILRISREINEKSPKKDKILYSILKKHQINVPEIYEYNFIDGKPAVVMQRIDA